MIRINQLKLPLEHSREDLEAKAAGTLKIARKDLKSLRLVKQSVDARKKEELKYIYSVDVEVAGEKAVLHKVKSPDVLMSPEKPYRFPKGGDQELPREPVIVGSGPAGLFCGLMLARGGYRPVILERGEEVEKRTRTVEAFWAGGPLNLNSNVQFGEGGAGTFSDGKLNTLVKDTHFRNRKVLELLTEFGADSSILYVNKPHIGTDVLSRIVKNIRQEIIRLGGDVRFASQATDFLIEDGRLTGVEINGAEQLKTEVLVLAAGHSARDTFELLHKKQVPMRSKSFAVGLRIQHPQKMINLSQYGSEENPILGAASYKLAKTVSNGRGVYTFCMCPGGFVVNASSEEEALAVNGMSNHAREGKNANSAVIVTVTPQDYATAEPLAGVEFQRKLEKAMFRGAQGKIPIQLYGDFKNNKTSSGFGEVGPELKGLYEFANLRGLLPDYLSASLVEGIDAFGGMIKGFSRQDALLAGVESRTSSPVRIARDENFESEVKGLYPCGEGAGYAGGITSAAMDGIKVAEQIARIYKPIQ